MNISAGSMHNLLKFLEKCKVNNSRNILNTSFGTVPEDLPSFYDSCHNSSVINEIIELYNLPIEFKIIYSRANDDSEITCGDTIFLSPNKIKNKIKDYTESNQNDWIDIAIKYEGVGWYCVIAWHKILKKCFVRYDGGSNSYDRNDNYMFYIASGDFQIMSDFYKKYLFDFDLIINNIESVYDAQNVIYLPNNTE